MAALEVLSEYSERPAVRQGLGQSAATLNESADGLLGRTMAMNAEHKSAFLWTMNKALNDPRLRSEIAQTIASKLNSLHKCSNGEMNDDQTPEHIRQLDTDGLTMMPDLVSADAAADILQHLSNCPNRTPKNNAYFHEVPDVVGAPHVLRIASDKRLLSVVKGHLGAPGIIISLNAWWTPDQGNKKSDIQVFHRDRDDFRACKLFVYIKDTGTEDGPHMFVRGSHLFERVRQAMPESTNVDALTDIFFSGNGRHVEHLVDDVFGPSVLEITGQSGTSFVENTYGFHKGKIPKGGHRCIFEITFGLLPYRHRVKHFAQCKLNSWPEQCEDHDLARQALTAFL